jgi:hypothetical protein
MALKSAKLASKQIGCMTRHGNSLKVRLGCQLKLGRMSFISKKAETNYNSTYNVMMPVAQAPFFQKASLVEKMQKDTQDLQTKAN